MMPPAATALTTAAEVQLAGVPFPTVRVGLLVSTARAADGTDACPLGLPGLGSVFGLTGLAGVADAEADVEAEGAPDDDGRTDEPGEDDKTDEGSASTNDGVSAEEDVAE
jgi:hypothetical protein